MLFFFINLSAFFFFNDPAPTEIYTLSLHDALPICLAVALDHVHPAALPVFVEQPLRFFRIGSGDLGRDRKSTRLNSSHGSISYAVFCLKKKKNNKHNTNSDSSRVNTLDRSNLL